MPETESTAGASVFSTWSIERTETSARAHLLLPVASFAEADGTLVSQEGRAQRFFQVYEPSYYDGEILIRESWRWLHALHSTLLGKPLDWSQLDQVTEACAASQPLLAGIEAAAPKAAAPKVAPAPAPTFAPLKLVPLTGTAPAPVAAPDKK